MRTVPHILKLPMLLLAISSLVGGCYYDNREDLYQNIQQPCELETISFAAHIEPVISQNCAFSGCHLNPGAAAGLDLSDHGAISAAALNGALIQRIERNNGEGGQMPPSGRMGQCHIDQIKEWALAGAPNN